MKNLRAIFALIIFALLIAVFLIWFFGWRPALASLDASQEERREITQTALKERSRQAALQTLIPRQGDLGRTSELLLSGYVDKDAPLEIILPLEDLAEQTNTDISITFKSTPIVARQPSAAAADSSGGPTTPAARPDPLGALESVDVQIQVTGSYHEILEMIEHIEQLSIKNEILLVEFAKPSDGPNDEDTRPSANVSARFFSTPTL